MTDLEAAEKALREAGFECFAGGPSRSTWIRGDVHVVLAGSGVEWYAPYSHLSALLRPGYSESEVRNLVANTLHTVDDKANGWSKAAREAVHEAMGILLYRLRGEKDG